MPRRKSRWCAKKLRAVSVGFPATSSRSLMPKLTATTIAALSEAEGFAPRLSALTKERRRRTFVLNKDRKAG